MLYGTLATWVKWYLFKNCMRRATSNSQDNFFRLCNYVSCVPDIKQRKVLNPNKIFKTTDSCLNQIQKAFNWAHIYSKKTSPALVQTICFRPSAHALCTAFNERFWWPGQLPHNWIKQERYIRPRKEDLRNYRLISLTPPPGAMTDQINPLGNQLQACEGPGESEQPVRIYWGQTTSDLQWEFPFLHLPLVIVELPWSPWMRKNPYSSELEQAAQRSHGIFVL